MIITALILLFLGLVAGSFVNALVWRLHAQELEAGSQQPRAENSNLSVLHGRSQCPNCNHKLSARDLVPILSWLFLRGRCRYCQAPISRQYPVVELAAAAVFVTSYYFWPVSITGGAVVLFVAWLVASVGLLALLIYDARWMLLPSKIIYPTLAAAAIGRLIYLLGYQMDKPHAAGQWALALLISSGFFWLLFIFSSGRYIGYGDVRLGLITGTLLATPAKSFLMLFLASTLGLIFALPPVLKKQKSLSSQIPFGPFLIVATGMALLFGDSLINWYTNLWL